MSSIVICFYAVVLLLENSDSHLDYLNICKELIADIGVSCHIDTFSLQSHSKFPLENQV